jgi:ATP-binding cassette, subfamily F, member 3
MIQLRSPHPRPRQPALVEMPDLQLHDGWRVGLVGANGSGKSSLFALLRGELQTERGECRLPIRLAHRLGRAGNAGAPAARHRVRARRRRELRRVEHALAAAHTAHDGLRIGELHAELEAIDGYAARARAAALLAGLGFARPISSGRWRSSRAAGACASTSPGRWSRAPT